MGKARTEYPVHVTRHAIERYIERVAQVSECAVRCVLSGSIIQRGAAFGSPFIRLGTGQRVVLDDATVVTVLPKDCKAGYLDPRREQKSW